jgi:tripartite-type tricarboxylate transporter receptor subunit TctC
MSSTPLSISDIPTFGEMTSSPLFGLSAPKATPKNIIHKLGVAAIEALADPAVQTRFVDFGFEAFGRERQTSETLGALVKADAEKWWPVIKEFGIRAQ